MTPQQIDQAVAAKEPEIVDAICAMLRNYAQRLADTGMSRDDINAALKSALPAANASMSVLRRAVRMTITADAYGLKFDGRAAR